MGSIPYSVKKHPIRETMDRSDNLTRTVCPAIRHSPDDVNPVRTDGDVRRKSP